MPGTVLEEGLGARSRYPKFFDSVDHDLMVKAVEANTDQQWVVLYVKRWLKAPLQLPDGTLQERDQGTPQGSAVSPVLANLFMHYAFDCSWMARSFRPSQFERYADDAVVHCVTERQAQQVWDGARPRGWRGRVAAASRQNQDRVLPGRASGAALTSTCRSRSWGTRSARAVAEAGWKRFSPRSCPRSVRRPSRAIAARSVGWRLHLRTARSERARPSGSIRSCAGWMNYYGRFYRSACIPSSAHQHLPDAVGSQEVQTTARLQTVPARGGPGSSNESPDCSRTGPGRAHSTGPG